MGHASLAASGYLLLRLLGVAKLALRRGGGPTWVPNSVVRARIDGATKARATKALTAMGLTVSDAIRLLLRRVADEKRLPFAVQVPNSSTLEAMKELDDGKGQRFDNAEELLHDL